MKNTDFSLSALGNIISSSETFDSLMQLIDGLDLEVGDVTSQK